MNKVNDLAFDCSTWDENGDNFVGMTGIMFDSCIEDERGNLITVGEIGIEIYLNKELADACKVSLDTIEDEIYEGA